LSGPFVETDEENRIKMSIRHISSKIELGFWQIAISLLSDSRYVQQLVCWFYLEVGPVSRQFVNQLERRQLLRWSAAGLGLGLLAGFLIAVF
jgi:hypothetical protein